MSKYQVYLGENNITKFTVFAKKDGWRAKNTASFFVREYIRKLTGKMLQRVEEEEELCISITEITEGVHDEYYAITTTDKKIELVGGRRGVIYAALEFIERCLGIEYYGVDCEALPKNERVQIPVGLQIESKEPIVEYRDWGGKEHSYRMPEAYMRLRMNKMEHLDSAYGGGLKFANAWHSLGRSGLLSKPIYWEAHPEYFSLVNGKRLTDGSGQLCYTNEGVFEAVVRELKEVIKRNPDKQFVSVSLDDNVNICECEACKKAMEGGSFSDLHFGFVNRVAREIKGFAPKVRIHTFAYLQATEPPTFPMEDNVAVQIAKGHCINHALDDENCRYNKDVAGLIQRWGEKCAYIMIWDYTDNHQVNLFVQPDVLYFRKKIRFMVENGVRGYFAEDGHHMEGANPCTVGFSELKGYLLSKLLKNPYMSDEEYQNYFDGFLTAYYGDGGSYLKEYLQIWAQEASTKHVNFNCFSLENMPLENDFERDISKFKKIDLRIKQKIQPMIPLERTKEVCAKSLSLFDKAMALAKTKLQKQRVEVARLQVLFYELYWTMNDTMKKGTAKEKAVALKKNKTLIDTIIKYRIKVTMYRGTAMEQASEISDMYEVSPADWGYGWWRDGSK